MRWSLYPAVGLAKRSLCLPVPLGMSFPSLSLRGSITPKCFLTKWTIRFTSASVEPMSVARSASLTVVTSGSVPEGASCHAFSIARFAPLIPTWVTASPWWVRAIQSSASSKGRRIASGKSSV